MLKKIFTLFFTFFLITAATNAKATEFSLDKNNVSFYNGIDENCILMVASYTDGKLIDSKLKPLEASVPATKVSISELGLDVTIADTLKAYLMSDTQKPVPLNVNRRLSLSENTMRDAYLLAQSSGTFTNPILSIKKTPVENIIGGWVLDNRGGPPRLSIEEPVTTIEDISTSQGTAFIREFNKITEDVIRADFFVSASADGFYVEFRDEQDMPVYKIKTQDKKWQLLLPDGSYTELCSAAFNSNTRFRVYLDLRTGMGKTYINDKYFGEHALLSDSVLNFRFASEKESILNYTPSNVQFVANYHVFEDFGMHIPQGVYGWKTTGSYYISHGTLYLNSSSALSASFESINTDYAAESQIRIKSGQDATMLVKAGDCVAAEIKFIQNALYANGRKLYTLKYPDLWYKVRIEGSPSDNTADIYLNGRIIGAVPMYTSSPIDSFEISSECGGVSFDDIKVFELFEHDDYVPVPETKANLDDYIVAVNVCSLWKNTGYSAGWGCISPYEENKPVIGYYDEGIPETADWEIKYMVEHGIDVQSYCWYNNSSYGPIKTPWGGDHLHDGYMHAKYSDYIKYIIMWETNATGCNSAQFRNYIVPFWFENYFLDDRYLKIDNKIVLNVWSVGNLITDKYFGSYDALKAELDYLEEQAKAHGFDGVILLTSITTDTEIYKCGFDGSMAYNWGANGYLYEHNVNENIKHASSASEHGYYHVPTISIGFNGVPWGYNRTPNITVEDYKKCHEWVRDTYLPTYASKDSWNEKLVWLSTWNEYGEGTYIMPADLCGFGYLDAVRSTYTSLGANHIDNIPTDSQLERITHLFPQYARRLVRLRDDNKSSSELTQTLETFKFIAGKTAYSNASITVNADGSIKGVSSNHDPIVYVSGITKSTPVDISEVDVVRVVAKVPENSFVQLFYRTDLHPAIDSSQHEKQSETAVAHSDEYTTFDFFVSHKDNWEGNLTELRIDPTSYTNAEFYIQKVEFLKYNLNLCINGIEMKSGVFADVINGKLILPFDTDTALQYILHTHATWRKDDGLFILEAGSHKAEFTVGSDTFVFDGEQKNLGYEMYLKDGVPMLDMQLLSELFGFEYSQTDENVYINTPEKNMYDEYLLRNTSCWEFNGLDTEGFVPVEMELTTTGTHLHLESNSASGDPDPKIILNKTINIPASEFNVFEIRARYKFEKPSGATTDNIQVFYATESSTSFSESKSFRIPLATNDTNGEWVTYKIKLDDSTYPWNTVATKLRIDPFNATGYMDVDYIRFLYEQDYVDVSNPLEIFAGDAEGITTAEATLRSTSSTLSVIEDEGPFGTAQNQVYHISGNTGKKYVFFKHNTMLRNGITYKISFDIKLLGDCTGNTNVKTNVVCDFTYPDTRYTTRTDYGHHFGHTSITPSDGWVHIEKVHEVKNIDDYTNHYAGFFVDPTSSGQSAVYMVDNFKITET